MVKSILVPVDGSPFSEHAIPRALAIARATGASVELVMVHGRPSSSQSGDASREAAAKDEDIHMVRATYFSSLVDAPHGGAPDRVTAAVLEGPVVDLIAMATHARSGVHRAVAGSVADEVLRAAPCAVLLAPGVQPPDA